VSAAGGVFSEDVVAIDTNIGGVHSVGSSFGGRGGDCGPGAGGAIEAEQEVRW
jgi:hypothetical protein